MGSTQSGKAEAPLNTASSFRFSCDENIPCFTQCCRDVNIYLTPYDVLRLRRALKMGSSEFLAKHTRHYLARVTHVPVVQFEMSPDTLYCKFVTDKGCSVYENRPWACRMFPLDLGNAEGEYRLIQGKERCLGLLVSSSCVVGDWLESQGVEPYVEMEKAFQEVMPSGFKPGAQMDAGLGKLLFMAYDLDRFAALLEDERFRTFYDIDDELLARVRADEEALLRLAFRYIRSQLEDLYQAV